jgi:superfamily II DNA or RNA helicase
VGLGAAGRSPRTATLSRDRGRPILRPYRIAAVTAICAEFAAGRRLTLIALATGLTKTVVFSEFARSASGLGSSKH